MKKTVNTIQDASFLRELDKQVLKTQYVKIIVCDSTDHAIEEIQGRVTGGSITIDGNSNVRRAGNITFVAEEVENDLTDITNLLSYARRIRIYIGIKNTINSNYEDIIWFNQGIFIITQPNISHTTSGVTISLSLKDKMCLLNGDCGGGLPTSVQFDSYDQYIGDAYPITKNTFSDESFVPNDYTVYTYDDNGTTKYYMWTSDYGWDEDSSYKTLINAEEPVTVKQKVFDIIQTLVCNYGGEPIENIIINDIDLELKQLVRNTSSDTLYYNASDNRYSYKKMTNNDTVYDYNEDVGYEYVNFTYPGELTTGIGDNVCTVLDAIVNELGNYEYFYDIDGHFVFQEKKNYLNTAFNPIQSSTENNTNNSYIIDNDNYWVDFSNISKSIYTFEEGSTLISSYSNSPNYQNIKNDYHIWGENDAGLAIHYHIAIKEKPSKSYYDSVNNIYTYPPRSVVYLTDDWDKYTGKLRLTIENEKGVEYIADDWRAELYLQGLEAKKENRRPDIYQQELLDLFDNIYNMKEKTYKTDMLLNPNNLTYFVDYLDPIGSISNISVDTLGTKIYSYQQDNLNRLFDSTPPNVILIKESDGTSIKSAIHDALQAKCEDEGQTWANIDADIYENISIGTSGYTAAETAKNLLYQYTNYNESISITSIPIYYLEPNNRITVRDPASGIKGDYVINSINIPLSIGGTMTIQASRALDRI